MLWNRIFDFYFLFFEFDNINKTNYTSIIVIQSFWYQSNSFIIQIGHYKLYSISKIRYSFFTIYFSVQLVNSAVNLIFLIYQYARIFFKTILTKIYKTAAMHISQAFFISFNNYLFFKLQLFILILLLLHRISDF